MATRSKHLWGPEAVVAAPEVLYTCPTGETALIKCIALANTAVLGNTVTFRLNSNAGGSTLWGVTLGAGGSALLTDLFIVLQPGETFRAEATATSIIVTGFGAELEGVTD